jgi:uncharacterized protein (TIGR03435 family)
LKPAPSSSAPINPAACVTVQQRVPHQPRRFRFAFFILALCFAPAAFAQPIAFAVASVKPSPPPPPNPFGFPPRMIVRVEPGRFDASQITLLELIRRAYDLPDFQIDGRPAWLTSDRFEVSARGDTSANGGRMRSMLQTLLQQRFALRSHLETQERPVFELVVTARNGQPGRQLRPSATNCVDDCAITYQVNGGAMTMTLRGKSIDDLIRSLVTETRRPVIDKTGLTGTFDGELTFAPQPLPGLPPPPVNPDAASVFTALQEQFGLRLRASRGPVQVLVIDAAERPSPNE